jgi:hypothetical protein
MAKKLTNETLEKLVLETMEEPGNVNELLGAIKNWAMGGSKPASVPFGRPTAAPKSSAAPESEAVQLLQLIASDPKVPADIKSQIADFLHYEPSTPKMGEPAPKMSTPRLPARNVKPLPAEEDLPTVKMSDAEKRAARMKTANPSPQAFAGTTKGRRAAPSLSPFASTTKGSGFARMSESKIEALVMEALEEMSKKKDDKKPAKK